ncbi:MAG: small multi-drug export protein [Clostridiales bacterium]|jgi:uncharacterized membrane protein|nr:small multi-drug export protein [Clostridiales bacterium]
MTDAVINFFQNITIQPEVSIFIVSLLPILELRGGLVLATFMGVPMIKAFAICYMANVLPVPLILLFIKSVFKFLKRFKTFAGVLTKLENSAMKKSASIVKKQLVGLFLFVAIPLPGTGAWTGAFIASLLGMDIKKSFIAIILGVLGAGIIMITLTYFIPGLFGMEYSF